MSVEKKKCLRRENETFGIVNCRTAGTDYPMSSYNQNVSIRELEITSLRVFNYTPVYFFSEFNQVLSQEV